LETVAFLDFIDHQIAKIDQRMLSRSEGYNPDLGAALEHLLTSGGKRIRPAVVILTGTMLGADEGPLISLGASIELLHTATLVHDDLIDGSLLRRGIPTLNSNWSPEATVLTGDFIFAQAAEITSEIGSTEIMSLFAKTLSVIVNGEVRQLFSEQQVTSREEYFRRIYEKTGSLFVLAAHAAALISSADDSQVEAAKKYGDELGKAFQIVDDVLDFVGDEERLGKPIGRDLYHGVLTLPTLYYMEQNPGDEDLRELLDGKRDNQLVVEVVEKIKSSGSIEPALDDARGSAERAVEALQVFPAGKEKEALKKLAQFVVERDV